MRFGDLLKLSLRNLWRRKLRTFLTILGVLIGTTSIVVMVSFAVAQTAYFYDMINANNELTTVTVRKPYDRGDGKDKSSDKKLNDELVETLSHLKGVTHSYPVLEKQAKFKAGNMQAHMQIVALPNEALKDYKYDMRDAEGKPVDFDYEHFSKEKIQLVIGDDVPKQFYNPKSRSFNDDWEKDKIDPFAANIAFFLDVENAYGSSGGAGGEGAMITPKRYRAEIIARIKPSENEWQSRYRIYTNLDTLVTVLKKEFRGRGFDSQPRTKSGRWTGEIEYSYITLRTDSLESSKELVKVIQDMGYQPESQAAWIDQVNEQMKQAALVFGGIGAISLLVAAIGIANTMMMSIYERTKEIGVFKVLGCKLPAIRNMFLIEAGAIGFIGGTVGLILSTILSFAVNNAPNLGMMGMGGTAKASIIPLWLYGLGLLFATLIGMLAGLLPALRAMKLSPLEALRTE